MVAETGATPDDVLPEPKDSHEISQDQTENAIEEKEGKDVRPNYSSPFSFRIFRLIMMQKQVTMLERSHRFNVSCAAQHQ